MQASKESAPALVGCESCTSRGLDREALGLWILSYVCWKVFWNGCHSPFPEVSTAFCFFEVIWGLSSGGRFLV